MTTYKFEFTLSKVSGFWCLILATILVFKGDQVHALGWGALGMAIFNIKNMTSK
jgi:hypothetical protein